MTAILDAGPLVAAVDRADPDHHACRAWLSACIEPLYISPFALAEADHFLAQRVGIHAEIAMLRDVAANIALGAFSADDLRTAADLIERYADLDIRLADASGVVLAARHSTTRIVTLDQRHFRSLRSLRGEPFVLLPWDEPQRADPR